MTFRIYKDTYEAYMSTVCCIACGNSPTILVKGGTIEQRKKIIVKALEDARQDKKHKYRDNIYFQRGEVALSFCEACYKVYFRSVELCEPTGSGRFPKKFNFPIETKKEPPRPAWQDWWN